MTDHNLTAFFNPVSIAIIGTSPQLNNLGKVILNQTLSSFSGDVYSVNPKAKTVCGQSGYTHLGALPATPDLVVVVVPTHAVVSVVEEAGRLGVPGIIIISAGFRESGNIDGEHQLLKVKQKARILGPNCLGVIDRYSGVNTLFARTRLPNPGPVSLILQSGAIGIDFLSKFALDNIGLAKFISYGNAVDIKESELLAYLSEDSHTTVIGLYLEGILGTDFRKHAEEAVRNKPVVALVAGGGIVPRATLSHTGTLATNLRIIEGVFRQIGIFQVHTMTEFVDALNALSHQPVPRQSTLALVSNVGGPAMAALMQLQRKGITLSSLHPETATQVNHYLKQQKIHAQVLTNSDQHSLGFVDATGSATNTVLLTLLERFLADDHVGGGILIARTDAPGITYDISAQVGVLSQRFPDKPIVVYDIPDPKSIKGYHEQGIPYYPSPERAVDGMAALMHRSTVLYRTIDP